MFTGDPGRPGLPGLPGPYTVQIPHRVQKRDTGNLSQMLHKNALCYIHITDHYTIFFHPLQAIKWLVVVRSFAVKPAGAKGLTYYWIMSDFIFTQICFRCSTVAMQVKSIRSLLLQSVEKVKRQLEKIKATKKMHQSL